MSRSLVDESRAREKLDQSAAKTDERTAALNWCMSHTVGELFDAFVDSKRRIAELEADLRQQSEAAKLFNIAHTEASKRITELEAEVKLLSGVEHTRSRQVMTSETKVMQLSKENQNAWSSAIHNQKRAERAEAALRDIGDWAALHRDDRDISVLRAILDKCEGAGR